MNKLFGFFAVVGLLTCALLLAGCGGDGNSATLVSIAVTPANPTVALGATKQFTATGTYSDGTTKDMTGQVVWTSSDTSKATVGKDTGLGTAVAAGTTTITAASGSITGNTVLTVTISLTALSITPATPALNPGGTKQFTATGTYSDNSTKDLTSSVTWNSTNAATATIGAASGLAAAVAAGTTTITATSGGISQSVTLTVCNNYATGSWAATDLTTYTPTITGPAGKQITDFSSFTYGPSPWHYVAYPFTVDTTGSYSATASTPVVVNTTYFLTGLFSAGQPPVTPMGNFFAEVFSLSGPPNTASFTNLSLVAGQQYTALVAYNTGGSAGEISTVTITGPGVVIFNGN